MAACAHAGTVPEVFHFAFGSEYTVEKKGGTTTITHRPSWGDARRRPPEGALGNRRAVTISVEQARRIWETIAAIDVDAYRQPADADFEPAPPDMRHTESLTLVINGETIVTWSRGYAFLKPDLRRPLMRIEDLIRSTFETAAQ